MLQNRAKLTCIPMPNKKCGIGSTRGDRCFSSRRIVKGAVGISLSIKDYSPTTATKLCKLDILNCAWHRSSNDWSRKVRDAQNKYFFLTIAYGKEAQLWMIFDRLSLHRIVG
jgi:hypothetical protein